MSTVNHDGNDTNDYPTARSRPPAPDLTRILGGRLRQAIGDPGNFVRLHEGELRDEWLARATTVAIEMALWENDTTLVAGKELFDREHRDARNDAGLLAFIVRDFMAAAGYPYRPDRPLTDQATQCAELIRTFRKSHEQLEIKLGNQYEHHAAEVQRLTDLVSELRKQLAGALALARNHGAQIEPWDYPEPAAALSDAASWAEFRREAALEDPAIDRWREVGATIPTPTEWNRLVEQRDGLRKIVMDKDEELEHAVTDTLHDAVTKIRAIAALVGPEGRIDTDELADYIGCPCRPGAPQHEHGKGGYQLAEPTRRASAEAELTQTPAVLGDVEVTTHD